MTTTPATQTLADFLSARLDEDEAAARAAISAGSPRWKVIWDGRVEVDGASQDADVFDYTVVFDEGSPSEEQAAHIARHDPARVLAQVAAKRAVLALHRDLPAGLAPQRIHETLCRCCNDYAPCPTLRHLASVYSDHPGYDAERWAVE